MYCHDVPQLDKVQVKANTVQTEKHEHKPDCDTALLLRIKKDTVLCHLCHQIIIVKEKKADHSDDE